jgi:glycosyltransferase involved in cell wall biosynthesis
MTSLVVAIPVRNEGRHIRRVYENALKVSQSVYFFDSDSTDETISLILSTSAKLVKTPEAIKTFSHKLNFIYSYPELSGTLILALHADELIEDSSVPLLRRATTNASATEVFVITRQSYFLGSPLRWGRSSQRIARLAGFKTVRYQDALIDERLSVISELSSVVQTQIRIIDNPLISPDEWFAKHNYYSTLEAKSILSGAWRHKPLNVRLYYYLPIFLRPFLLFAVRYFMLLGFLDGGTGLAYQVSHSIIYRLMVDVKLFHYYSNRFLRARAWRRLLFHFRLSS